MDKIWTARIITLIPEVFPGILGYGVAGRALRKNFWALDVVNLRQFGLGKHRTVDDTPAGGGAGMVLRADVVGAALQKVNGTHKIDWPLVFLTPRGAPFTQSMAKRWAECQGVTFLCARFEGIDERVIEAYAPEEVSLGDFVLSGGEIVAQALIDATLRLIPCVLGNEESLCEESFAEGMLEYPHYTRPVRWEGRDIPEVLLSGHHAQIALWRREQAERLTKSRRPDLWQARDCARLVRDDGTKKTNDAKKSKDLKE